MNKQMAYIWEIENWQEKKLMRNSWLEFNRPQKYIYFDKCFNEWKYNRHDLAVGEAGLHDLLIYPDWEEFKQPRKIKLYRHTLKSLKNDIIRQTDWASHALLDKDDLGPMVVIKTEEKEIEIEIEG